MRDRTAGCGLRGGLGELVFKAMRDSRSDRGDWAGRLASGGIGLVVPRPLLLQKA
jgi:hypothetical protein